MALSVSEGAQPTLLSREECGAAAGEEGWRARCNKVAQASDQPEERPFREVPASIPGEEARLRDCQPCIRDTGRRDLVPLREPEALSPFPDPRLCTYQPHIPELVPLERPHS